MEDDIFIKVCNESESMRKASIYLNMSFSTFKRKATQLGCYKTNQFWSRGKTTLSDDRIKSTYNIDDIFVENSKVRRDQVKNIIIKENLIKHSCLECGNNGIWNGKFITLHLDHINGVRNDNRLNNLRFLCPNCHSQTPTYCNNNRVSKKITNMDIEYIIDVFSECKSISDVLINLGIIDTTKNRNKLKLIKDEYNLSFLNKS